VVVVDDDIDITDQREVMWALASRVDPAEDLQVVKRSWSSSLDTATRPGSNGMNSRLIFDATRPWEHRHDFASPVAWPGGNTAADRRWERLFGPQASDIPETRDEGRTQ
jgi:3-polyprenyl-4-hydroxybenzoate decarboxylase